MRCAFDHGVQRHRGAAGATARSEIAGAAARLWPFPAPGAPVCDLRHYGYGVSVLSRAGQHPVGGDRPVVVCGYSATGARLLWRSVLAPGDCARSHFGHGGRRRGVDIHLVSAELPGRQPDGPASAAARTSGHRGVAAAGAVRRRSAAAAAWRAVVAFAEPSDVRGDVVGSRAVLDRTIADRSIRPEYAGADDADLSA